ALEHDCRAHLRELDHLAPWIPLVARLGEELPPAMRMLVDAIPTYQSMERLPDQVAEEFKQAAPSAGDPGWTRAREAMKPLRSQCLMGAERAAQRIQWSENLARQC